MKKISLLVLAVFAVSTLGLSLARAEEAKKEAAPAGTVKEAPTSLPTKEEKKEEHKDEHKDAHKAEEKK